MPSTGVADEPPEITSCPGVIATSQWDEAAALRGEIHTAERLAEHAIEVARAHGIPSLRVAPGPLRKRFADARERIDAAYDILSRTLQKRRRPSPAEEWLLDNSHVVEDQIREIQEDLPWGYLVELLPRLAHGAMRGYLARLRPLPRLPEAHRRLASMCPRSRATCSRTKPCTR